MELYIGYDIGSVSVNRAVVDNNLKVVDVLEYTRHHGEPLQIIQKDLSRLLKKYAAAILVWPLPAREAKG
ncbi:MAG: hypothetical protein U5N58_03370 [Actinomycetota bacterium]|nr:hypothetical protein [Actinomycetota bacterium]